MNAATWKYHPRRSPRKRRGVWASLVDAFERFCRRADLSKASATQTYGPLPAPRLSYWQART